ncbi:hypothetical protein [Bacillus sp. SM2101]|uniref:hypothetical protein n=1 Tax=Bacillaceae TaxID=186817 RepID=UPI001BDF6B28|nr:hypothetical protein [Bacillus sp. SM2101]
MSVCIDTTLPDFLLANQQYSYQSCDLSTEPDTGTEVRTLISLGNPKQVGQFEVKVLVNDTFVEVDFDENGVFLSNPTILDNKCSQFLITFFEEDNYRFQVTVFRISDGKELAEEVTNIRVADC